MLAIRAQQLEDLEASDRTRFVEKAVDHLRETFPENLRGYAAPILQSMIRDSIARAEQIGFHTRRQIICFVDAEVLAGLGFHELPENDWARRVTANDSLNP